MKMDACILEGAEQVRTEAIFAGLFSEHLQVRASHSELFGPPEPRKV
jgi:hypothetical protein